MKTLTAPRFNPLLPPALALAAALLGLAAPASARPASCETSDDGAYPCDFQPVGRDGSFTLSARGKPTYQLLVVEPGVASGYVNFGDRNVSLPGLYLRSRTDPGCWVNDQTATRICAR